MAHWQHSDNWLSGIGAADHPNHGIYHAGQLSVKHVQAAFDLQYGYGEFNVKDHGTVITVWSYPGYRRYRQRRGESATSIEQKIVKIKSKDDE